MIRIVPRWLGPFTRTRPSRSTLAALLCVAVALLSYGLLVAYESGARMASVH